MKKILFLTEGKKDMIRQGNYGPTIEALPIYKNRTIIARLFVRLLYPIMPKQVSFFLGEWAKGFENYDVIVCEGLKCRSWVFKYILKNKQKSCRLIMWHWNKIYKDEISPTGSLACACEQWSFDPDDCREYGFNYNSQYFGTIDLPAQENIEFDLYFLGADKGRFKDLENLYIRCLDEGVKPYFHIVKSEEIECHSESISFSEPISYEDNIKNAMCSRAILDIPLKGQKGLTLRVMEALYLQKKLVTFNESVKDLPFYNSNNILIYDKNVQMNNIKEFIQSPYIDTAACKEARKFYSFTEWMKRFENV